MSDFCLAIKMQSSFANTIPQLRTDRPLIPGHPPASHLPLNPVMYLTVAVDSVAPLIRIKTQRGAGGGGASLQIPVPLYVRQRRRTALKWIVDSASNKTTLGGGKDAFAKRLADEIIAIVEGRSTIWDKRQTLHKVGVVSRANVGGRRRFGRR
jgi:small subunit ribosomal protein S7